MPVNVDSVAAAGPSISGPVGSIIPGNTPVVLSQSTRAFRNIINQAPADNDKPYASITYTAVIRGKVALPCNIEPPTAGDEVVLVLWYKDDIPAPIFTLDARRGDNLERAPQSTLSDLGKRAYFNMANKPAFLQVDPVQEGDAGEYRCRVDFKRARSINTVINLRVIIPSGEPVIFDEEGTTRLRGLVGPFNEGDPLVLVCQSEQGKPRPSVTWWKDYRLLDDSYFFDAEDNLVKNVLEIEALTRDDLLSVVICQASNNNITVPSPVSVTLDLNLKPLDVSIEHPPSQLSANQQVLLKCTSSGSRPAAKLSWWMSGQQLKATREDEASLKSSSSVLIITPTADDNGKMISCRAENALIPGSALEHGLRLDVHYPPAATLELASYINPEDIREQMDIRLTCHVTANPQPVNVTWLFEGDRLRTDLLPRVIQSSTGILIRRIQRVHRGRYMCQAENSQGRGTSNEIYLKLKFSPLCKSKQRVAYGVPSEGEVSVLCDVEADPDDVVFQWAFNSSLTGRVHNLSVTDNTKNVYNYKVSNLQVSYGILLCWAKNSIGIQKEPCRYRIVPAGPPDPLVNCTQINATSASIALKCFEGSWDGGLRPLNFFAQVYDVETGALVANTSHHSSPSNITIGHLSSGASFRVAVFAVNVKGVSAPHVIMAQTMRQALKYTEHEVIVDLNPILIFVALAVPLTSVIFFFILRFNCTAKLLQAWTAENKVIVPDRGDGDTSNDDDVKKLHHNGEDFRCYSLKRDSQQLQQHIGPSRSLSSYQQRNSICTETPLHLGLLTHRDPDIIPRENGGESTPPPRGLTVGHQSQRCHTLSSSKYRKPCGGGGGGRRNDVPHSPSSSIQFYYSNLQQRPVPAVSDRLTVIETANMDGTNLTPMHHLGQHCNSATSQDSAHPSVNAYGSPIYQRPLSASLQRRQSLYYQKSMINIHNAYLYDSPVNSRKYLERSSNLNGGGSSGIGYNTLPLRRELLKSEYYLELTDDNVESSV
ncbi:hemicentin-1-like [Varroa jacobsoni]|uniref:hemicentin-1-like n=1 Tax=Varroa jacobsoni TaxID=62625 RepID=UPI000BF4DD3E|nr:hemicentin-1-like [Varroa jacobsoni]